MKKPVDIEHTGVIRRVDAEDEIMLRTWLNDPIECLMAIGHHPFTEEDFDQWMKADDQLGWVLETEDGPIGYGEVWVDAHSRDLELAHIIVNPEFRGLGWGKRLTNLLYHEACAFGFPWVYMRVNPDNTQALMCYQSVQFTRLDELLPGMAAEWIWLARACDFGR